MQIGIKEGIPEASASKTSFNGIFSYILWASWAKILGLVPFLCIFINCLINVTNPPLWCENNRHLKL